MWIQLALLALVVQAWASSYFVSESFTVSNSTHDPISHPSHELLRGKRQAWAYGRKWPNNSVYYCFFTAYSNEYKTTMRAALSKISRDTCIDFEEDCNQAHTVKITAAEGNACWSYLGMHPNEPNKMSLGIPGCMFEDTEFFHALGFYHTQQRPDRDDFITVNFNNVDQFNKYSKEDSDLYSSYDYYSIMQYQDER